MKPWHLLVGTVVLAAALAQPLHAQPRDRFDDPYSIMVPEQPEPWLAPKYKSPRGLKQHPRPAHPHRLEPPRGGVAAAPPPIVLQNGRVIPSLPPRNQGIVPGGGRETFSDRVSRCVQQGALYGVPAGQQGIYMNTCAMGQ